MDPLRRERRKRRRGEPDIPVSSFADIAFLLIIYFILATSLSLDMGLRTDIPAGQKASQATEDKSILLSRDGLFWGQRQLTVDELSDELAGLNLAEKDPNGRVVQFEARGNVSWQQYYEVLAAIGQAGGVPGIVMDTGEGP